jgi:hypothetical protein
MAEQDRTDQVGHTAEPHASQPAGSNPTTWRPAPEPERVRVAAAGLGALRPARQELGPAGEFQGGIALAAGSV